MVLLRSRDGRRGSSLNFDLAHHALSKKYLGGEAADYSWSS